MKHIFHSRKAIASVAIILITGVMLGFVAGWALHDSYNRGKAAKFRQRIGWKFTNRLKLTPEQRQQFEPMLDRWEERFYDRRARHIEDILQNLDIQRREIKTILTPEQDRLMDQLYLETIEKIKQKGR